MTDTRRTLEQMRREPANVRFSDLIKVCEAYFGTARQSGSSHAVFKTPWPGDPRGNVQNDKGKAKVYQVYQVRQVLKAIEKLQEGKNAN
ncbi:toxin HicA [Cupriavidus necator]